MYLQVAIVDIEYIRQRSQHSRSIWLVYCDVYGIIDVGLISRKSHTMLVFKYTVQGRHGNARVNILEQCRAWNVK